MMKYFRLTCHGIGAVMFLCLCLVVATLGASFTRDRPFPYIITKREMSSQVTPGGNLDVTRTIRYLDDDCLLHYEYRAQSEVGKRISKIYPDVDYDKPPMDLDELPKTISYPIPKNMDCGPAYFVETPAASCGVFKRFKPWVRRDDVKSHFNVVGCEANP